MFLRFSKYIFFFFEAEAKTAKREVGQGTLVVSGRGQVSFAASRCQHTMLGKGMFVSTAHVPPQYCGGTCASPRKEKRDSIRLSSHCLQTRDIVTLATSCSSAFREVY